MQFWDRIRVKCSEWQGLAKTIVPSEQSKLFARSVLLQAELDAMNKRNEEAGGGENEGKVSRDQGDPHGS